MASLNQASIWSSSLVSGDLRGGEIIFRFADQCGERALQVLTPDLLQCAANVLEFAQRGIDRSSKCIVDQCRGERGRGDVRRRAAGAEALDQRMVEKRLGITGGRSV